MKCWVKFVQKNGKHADVFRKISAYFFEDISMFFETIRMV